MSPSLQSASKKTLLAVAIVTATGCASSSPNRDSGGLGDSLIRAGSATADAGTRAWHKTTYLLGFHDQSGDVSEPAQRANAEIDELDIALMQADNTRPDRSGELVDDDTVALASARLDRAIASGHSAGLDGTSDANISSGIWDADEQVMQTAGVEAVGTDSDVLDLFSDSDTTSDTILDTTLETVALDDYTHEVGENETLWDIAKMTTGDANNWHTLADINDLTQNAAVFPGQTLVIPADMVRPELAIGVATDEQAVVADAGERLAIPQGGDELTAQASDVAEPAAEPVLVVAGTSASPVSSPNTATLDDERSFSIEAGETLWDFAKRTTGDATYWQAIAAFNGFDDGQAVAVREGQKIRVPDLLIRPELAGGETTVAAVSKELPSAPVQPETSTAVAIADTSTDTEALDAGASVLAGTNGLSEEPVGLDETRDITIVEAAYRADSETDLDLEPAAASQAEIKISGTYYPKAIYNSADFSSSLLMRVSPGTTLTVSSIDGAWYQVQTDKGTGYVHNRDTQ